MKFNLIDFDEISSGCYIRKRHIESFAALGLRNVDDFVDFTGGREINKKEIAEFRNRQVFSAGKKGTNFYLKAYNRPPTSIQMANWFAHGKYASTAAYDYLPALELEKIGVKTPKVAAFGKIFKGLFEKKSFIVTEELIGQQSLEERSPDFFQPPTTPEKQAKRCRFIKELAEITKNFHGSGFFHRDYYLSHIFWGEKEGFTIIDLQRVFKPTIMGWRYRIKDIAQLYYSAPASLYSKTDRMRFYKHYAGIEKLRRRDKWFITQVKLKAAKMAAHDSKSGRDAPYIN